MFQFTTTNVINDLYWNGDKNTPLVTSDEKSFQVKGVNNFLIENITAVYKTVAREEENAEITLDFSAVESYEDSREKATKNKDVFRINLYIGLTQGSNDAMYSNDFYYKGKPLMIEFSWDTDAETTAKNLAKTIKRLQLNYEGEKMVDVIYKNGTTITIKAVNEYQRFVKASIEKLDPRAYNGVGDWEEVTDAVTEVSKGIEGFGTYNWILHNLRIPTAARNDMFGQNFEETPIKGRTYTQYVIHYCKNRGSLGLNAVGHQATSHTTHVFYVLDDGCTPDGVQAQFEEALKSALENSEDGLEIKEITIDEEGNYKEDAAQD